MNGFSSTDAFLRMPSIPSMEEFDRGPTTFTYAGGLVPSICGIILLISGYRSVFESLSAGDWGELVVCLTPEIMQDLTENPILLLKKQTGARPSITILKSYD